MTEEAFRLLDHTADTGFQAFGETLPRLFENAARALVAVAMNASQAQPEREFVIRAAGSDLDTLLVNFLSEVLWHIDGERLAPVSFSVESLEEGQIRCRCAAEPRDDRKHEPRLVVKGVTFHQLSIEQDSSGRWAASVFLDI